MRGASVLFFGALIASLGCGTPNGGGGSSPTTTADGLVKTDIDMPGALYVRDDHGIGSYDAFLVPPVAIHYKPKSDKLEMEEELKTLLRESLVDAMERNEIPVEDTAGPCVMQVGLVLYNVNVPKRRRADTLGTMTLVMEFRDSTSGQPLLRYSLPNRIERKGVGNRERQLRRGFDKMVDQMNVGQAMVAAGLYDQETRAGCHGTMAKRAKQGPPAVSAE